MQTATSTGVIGYALCMARRSEDHEPGTEPPEHPIFEQMRLEFERSPGRSL